MSGGQPPSYVRLAPRELALPGPVLKGSGRVFGVVVRCVRARLVLMAAMFMLVRGWLSVVVEFATCSVGQ